MEELRFVIPYDSKEDIPLSEYKNLHKQYWEFIAEHFDELKDGAGQGIGMKPNIYFKNGTYAIIINWCFACSYANVKHVSNINEPKHRCYYCPILAFDPTLLYPCEHKKSVYYKFICNPSKELALEIANLEWED